MWTHIANNLQILQREYPFQTLETNAFGAISSLTILLTLQPDRHSTLIVQRSQRSAQLNIIPSEKGALLNGMAKGKLNCREKLNSSSENNSQSAESGRTDAHF